MENEFEYTGYENLRIMENAINYNKFIHSLIEKFNPNASLTVDFGAGLGLFASTSKAWAKNLICVEPDRNQFNLLQNNGFQVVDDIDQIPDSSVDYIYCINVLEHIEDHLQILQKFHAKLIKGGVLLIYVPAFMLLFSSMDRVVGHFRRYDKSMMRDLIQYSNFRVVELQYADSIGFLASLLYKLLDSGDGAINSKMLKIYDRFIFPLSRFFDFFVSRFFGKNIFVVLERLK